MKPDWMGSLPRGWCVKRIKHTTYVKGRIGWQGLRSEEFQDEGPILVTGTDFENGRVNWETCYHISDERYREDTYIHLHEDDLLVTKDGSIGKLALVRGRPGPATLNSGIFVTRPISNEYSNAFLYYVLDSNVFADFVNFRSSGTTIDHLYQNVFVDFAFPMPPLDVQRAIADFLDRETAKIDDLVGRKAQMVRLLRERRATVVGHILQSMHGAGSGTRAKFVSSISVPGRNKPELTEGGPIPWITLDDITGSTVGSSAKGLSVSRSAMFDAGSVIVPPGSVIASCVGQFGIAAVTTTPCVINQQLQAYVPRKIDPYYLRYVVEASASYFEAVATATTIKYVNQDRFGSLPVPLASSSEQQSIVQLLNTTSVQTGAAIDLALATASKLREYRAALISAAVTGQLDLRKHEERLEALA
jgi:type I restriction enzyme S subunit